MDCCKEHKEVNVYRETGRYDPTKTLTLRNQFVTEMTKRFRQLRGEIRQAIINQDVFGLKEEDVDRIMIQANIPPAKAFAFARDQRKVSEFMQWLQGRVDAGVLEVTHIRQLGDPIDRAWTDMYIQDSYKRGVTRARYEMGKAGLQVPPISETGGISASLSTPFHMDRLGVLYTRTFQELKGITAAMDSQISRILSEGIANGDGPALLARKINSTISGAGMGELGITDSLGRFIPAERRAKMMARTEIIRAHHQATIQEYENWRVEGVRVQAEWRTAGFNVCEECELLEGQVFSLQEARGMIPVHPNCRCITLPTEPE